MLVTKWFYTFLKYVKKNRFAIIIFILSATLISLTQIAFTLFIILLATIILFTFYYKPYHVSNEMILYFHKLYKKINLLQ
jgi:hypothetical protein